MTAIRAWFRLPVSGFPPVIPAKAGIHKSANAVSAARERLMPAPPYTIAPSARIWAISASDSDRMVFSASSVCSE